MIASWALPFQLQHLKWHFNFKVEMGQVQLFCDFLQRLVLVGVGGSYRLS